MTVAPAGALVSTKLLLAGAIFFTIISVYYLVVKFQRSLLLPTLTFLLGLFLFWCYNISGLAYSVQKNVNTLVAVIPMEKPNSNQNDIPKPTEEYYALNRQGLFTAFASSKAINYLSLEEKQKFLENAFDKYAGPFLPKDQYPLYIDILINYYMSGPSKTAITIWNYAFSYPLENFNQNAKTNHAYDFLVMLLFAMAACHCLGGILFREDL